MLIKHAVIVRMFDSGVSSCLVHASISNRLQTLIKIQICVSLESSPTPIVVGFQLLNILGTIYKLGFIGHVYVHSF